MLYIHVTYTYLLHKLLTKSVIAGFASTAYMFAFILFWRRPLCNYLMINSPRSREKTICMRISQPAEVPFRNLAAEHLSRTRGHRSQQHQRGATQRTGRLPWHLGGRSRITRTLLPIPSPRARSLLPHSNQSPQN